MAVRQSGANWRQQHKAERFRSLHKGEAFVIPNPWDAGSARILAALGFTALASTSSGFAFTLGRKDGGATLDQLVDHVRLLDGATDLPLSVDLENGFGRHPNALSSAINRIAEAGAVGGSIEDYDVKVGIYERARAAERIAAAAEAAADLGFPFMLTARAENHVRGNPDLDDTIARLQDYEAAGADVLYAPGLAGAEEVRAVVDEISRPLNVLARPHHSLAELVEAGAQRVSVGGSLAWTAAVALFESARRIREDGDFSGLKGPGSLVDWLAN
jgi:2-methylisocitrate lyase-like PEP mutase family enzyme